MKGIIKIDRELCKGCRYCVLSCPKSVIAIEESFNSKGFFPALVLHGGRCTGCAMCAEMCPEMAIEVFRDLTAAETAETNSPARPKRS